MKRDKHTLWTVNDVTEKDPLERPPGAFPASVGEFHLKRPLKICKLKYAKGDFWL